MVPAVISTERVTLIFSHIIHITEEQHRAVAIFLKTCITQIIMFFYQVTALRLETEKVSNS